MKAGDGPGLEALPFAFDDVFADLDQREHVFARAISEGAPALAGGDARDCDLGARNSGAGGVGYQTCDFGGTSLCQRKSDGKQKAGEVSNQKPLSRHTVPLPFVLNAASIHCSPSSPVPWP